MDTEHNKQGIKYEKDKVCALCSCGYKTKEYSSELEALSELETHQKQG
jgi:hypothetical protein